MSNPDYSETINFDENKVGEIYLPELLLCMDGTTVSDTHIWSSRRNKEVLALFTQNIYGETPILKTHLQTEVIETNENALGGKANRRLIRLSLLGSDSHHIELQIISPKDIDGPFPTILGANFFGNHAVIGDRDVGITRRWMRNTPDNQSVISNQATEFSRGSESERWQAEQIVDAGFSLATFYYGDVEPDHPEGWTSGVRGDALRMGFNSSWGAVAAWAWGLSRALDYLEIDPEIISSQVFVMGHSRLGKAALWAGANDSRFAGVISNNSGAGGAALARRNFGENIQSLNENFPHWFCKEFTSFNNSPEDLPVDMHQLIALIAPRPIYIASASEDLWADPKGEFLAAIHAEPIYALFGKTGLGVSEWPAIDTSVGNTIGYHVRSGGHGVTAYDWQQFLQFATKHLRISK